MRTIGTGDIIYVIMKYGLYLKFYIGKAFGFFREQVCT